jgi:methionyl-tRNA formyltransferase
VRTVFFGTSAFAVPSLHALVSCTKCRFVVTQPDRPAGRGRRLRPTPVKVAARELGIAVLEPQGLQREEVPELLAEPFDLFVVTSYGKILPQWILELPRLGALNVHPSLLPLYRGATPLQSQIRDGVVESGVTVIQMDAGMDTGDVVLQGRSTIGARETYGELHDRFADLGATLLKQAIEQMYRGERQRTPQRELGREDAAAATLTRLLRREDFKLDAIESAKFTMSDLVNFIRSAAPKAREPGGGADACVASLSMKILAAHALAEGPPIACPVRQGVIVEGWILIRATDGWVAVDELREPGSRAVSIREFRNGYKETILPRNLTSWEPQIQAWYERSGKAALQSW